MNYIKILAIVVAGFLLFACEREIDLEIEGAGDTVIVEGYIYEDEAPQIALTKTYSFYDELTFEALNNIFIKDAQVFFQVNGEEIELQLLDLTPFEIPIAYYTLPNSLLDDDNYSGKRGNAYGLRVVYNDNEFTASTYIPNQTTIDSIWYEPHPDAEVYDTLVKLYVRTSDADTVGNKYRVYTQRNDEDFYTEDSSIFDDTVINGTSYDVPVNRSPEPFSDEDDFNTYGYFNKGDDITVRRCGIDKGVYNYFSSLEYITGGGGGPFGSATILNSNVKGDGVKGVWAGFSVEEISISVPE